MNNAMPVWLLPLVWYGVMFTITSATIFERPRLFIAGRSTFLAKLLSCSFCTGFHVGWLCYLAFNKPILTVVYVRTALVHGFAAATICYVIDSITKYFESNTRG